MLTPTTLSARQLQTDGIQTDGNSKLSEMKAAFVLLTIIFLTALMLVRGIEPRPSGPELFTLRRDNFYEVRFARTGQPEPMPVTGSAIAKRQHFGFPCYALIVDESRAGNLYTKLDLVRFTANGFVAALAAVVLSGGLRVFSRALAKGMVV